MGGSNVAGREPLPDESLATSHERIIDRPGVPAGWGVGGIQVGRGAGGGGDQRPGVPGVPDPAKWDARQREPEEEQGAKGDEGVNQQWPAPAQPGGPCRAPPASS
jgi:hypothetical protein